MCKITVVFCLMLAPAAMAASAEKITYIDATHGESGNTTISPDAGSGVWDLPENGGVGLSTDNRGYDDLWRFRTEYGNPEGAGTVYEAGGTYVGRVANTEDCPRLVTTISDLPEDIYKVYVYFWSDTSQWRIRASLTEGTDTSLPLFYSQIDRPVGEEMPPIAAPAAIEAFTQTNSAFKTAPLFKEENQNKQSSRTLWQGYLGEVVGMEIKVFIDDDPNHGTQNYRTWYDGIGYAPEPTTLTLLGSVVFALFLRKRA